MIQDETALGAELTGWCECYVAAFNRFDVETIGAHWAFPAMVVSSGRQIVLKDFETFNKNTSVLTEFYQRQSVHSVQRRVLSCVRLVEGSAAMRVQDVVFSLSGEKVTEWVSAYILRRTELGWKAIFADATGEVKAWAARGTPLGS